MRPESMSDEGWPGYVTHARITQNCKGQFTVIGNPFAVPNLIYCYSIWQMCTTEYQQCLTEF